MDNSVFPVKTEKVRGCKDLVNFLSQDFQMFSHSFETENNVLVMVLIQSRFELALGATDGLLIWFDFKEFKEIKKDFYHQKDIVGIKVSNSEKFVLSSSEDSTIVLHDLINKNPIANLDISPSYPETTCFTDDDKFVCIGSKDNIIYVWNIIKPGSPQKLLGHKDGIVTLKSINFQTIISCSTDSTLKIWDLQTYSEKSTLSGHTSWINTLILSNNKEHAISGSGDFTVRLWDLQKQIEINCFKGHTGEIYALAINNLDTILASGSQDKTVRVWNLKQKTLEYIQDCHISFVRYVVIPKDSNLVIGISYKMLNVDNFVDKRQEVSLEGHSKSISCIAITEDGNYIFSAGFDKTIKMWDIDEKEDKICMHNHTGSVSCLLVTNNNLYFVSGGWDSLVIVWTTKDKEVLHVLRSHSHYISALDQTHDGLKVASGSWDYTIKLWEVHSGILLHTFTEISANIYHVKISFKSSFIACTSTDYIAKFWSLNNYNELYSLSFPDFITELQISNTNLAVLSNLDGSLVISNAFKKRIEKQHKFQSGVLNFSLSLDKRKIIISLVDNTLRIWDFDEFEEIGIVQDQIYEWPVIIKPLSSSVFSVVSNKTELKIFEISKLSEVGSCKTDSVITYIKPSNNGEYCVIGCKNGEILIWNLAERRTEIVFKGHKDQIECMDFTEGFKYLISGSKDKTIKVWRFEKNLKNVDNSPGDETVDCAEKQNEISEILLKSGKVKKNSFEGNKRLYPPLIYNGFRQRFNKKLLPIKSDCKIILPRKVNLAHLYCYLGLYNHLDVALKLGCQVRRDNFNNSPLHYAIIKDSQKSTDVLLEFMIHLSSNENNHSKYFEYNYALREDFYKILKLSSSFIPSFLESIFVVSKDKSLPNSLRCLVPPVILFTNSTKISFNNFRNVCISLKKSTKFETFVEFRTTPIELDLTHGSSSCFQLCKSLLLSKNQKIFTTKLIRTILDYKHRMFYALICISSLTLAINLILMLACITTYITSKPMNLAYLAINCFLLIFEAFQIVYFGKIYFACIKNISDLISIALSIVWVVFNLMSIDLGLLKWFMVITNFIKGLAIFKVFDATRLYISLLIRAIKETYSFLIIFCYSTIAFGAIYVSSNGQTDSPFVMLWKVPYDLNFGVFNSNSSMTIEYVYFVLATLINIVMMLNLLIAILGDAFDKFQIEAGELDYKQKLESIMEIECLFYFVRTKRKKGFLQLCDYDYDDEERDVWEGKIKKIEIQVGKVSKEVSEAIRKNQEKYDGRLERIENKLDRILEGMEKKN